jgi:hypothetical protein
VREKRLDAQAAPSGLLFVTGGISNAIMEFRGRANPRIPLKLGARSSLPTSTAAAKHKIRQRRLPGGKKGKENTKCLIIDGVSANRNFVPNNGTSC